MKREKCEMRQNMKRDKTPNDPKNKTRQTQNKTQNQMKHKIRQNTVKRDRTRNEI